MDNCKKYSVKEITKLVLKIKGVYYPPSGKYYVFNDGSDCEDWNLEIRIEEKMEEICSEGGK